MPYAMLKFDRCCWKYVVALNTSRGAERTTLITEQANISGLNNPIVKKEVHLIKETNNVIQSMVLTKYLGYITDPNFTLCYVTFYRKTSIMI
jgi:hypothetical protein